MVDLNKGATVGLVKALSDDIRTDANGVKHLSAGAAVRDLYNKLENEIDALAEITHINSWADVQKAVRSGMANKIFSIGDQLTCQRNGVNLVWDIIGIDHDTPADSEYTHSMTLLLHDCFPTTMQFDAAEAFYYAESGLAAGTYHFMIDSSDYQFTLANAVPAGGQLILNWTGTAPTGVSVSPTRGGAIEGGAVSVTQGSGGTSLGTLTSAGDFAHHLNSLHRITNGSSNYKESAIRQWLNSSAAAGSVWTAQTQFDRPPLSATNTAGFMNGMDADFLAVIGNTHIIAARNTLTDGGGADEMNDKFFLLSRSEVFGGSDTGVNEGTAYPYYANYSDLTAAGTGNDSNRIKMINETPQIWILRSCTSSWGYGVRSISGNGAINSNYADSERAFAPACNII